MKNKILEIHFQSLSDFKKEVKRALFKRGPSLQPRHQLFFDSVESFRKFMTIQKVELLTSISIQKPSSIYELAKMVDRDFAAVLRDCVGLEGAGFIRLKETKDNKKTKIPMLSFGYSIIAVLMPKQTYQIEFMEAA